MPQRRCGGYSSDRFQRPEVPISFITNIVRVIRGGLSRDREVHVRLTREFEAVIYDRPGLWMSDRELEKLRHEIMEIGRAGVGGELTYGVFQASRKPYENRILCVGRHLPSGEAVGFNAMVCLSLDVEGRQRDVLHLGLLVIHPKYQGQGLQGLLYGLGAFSAFRRMRESPVWLSNVTEVPAVFGAVADNFMEPYPDFKTEGPPPTEHRAVARAIMAQARHEFGVGPEAEFDDERFVIMGSYTGGSDALKKTFESAPRYRDPRANEFCRRQLDYGRGDDFLQIAKLDAATLSAILARRVPDEFRPQAARKMRLWTYPARRSS